MQHLECDKTLFKQNLFDLAHKILTLSHQRCGFGILVVRACVCVSVCEAYWQLGCHGVRSSSPAPFQS